MRWWALSFIPFLWLHGIALLSLSPYNVKRKNYIYGCWLIVDPIQMYAVPNNKWYGTFKIFQPIKLYYYKSWQKKKKKNNQANGLANGIHKSSARVPIYNLTGLFFSLFFCPTSSNEYCSRYDDDDYILSILKSRRRWKRICSIHKRLCPASFVGSTTTTLILMLDYIKYILYYRMEPILLSCDESI